MGRLLSYFTMIWLLAGSAGAVGAQGFSGLARIDAETSHVRDTGLGAEVSLGLSQGVPYRLFTLDGPPRLVLDFQEVDWTGLTAGALLQGEQIAAAQFGTYVPGWSRLVLELTQPMQVASAEMTVDPVTAAARLAVMLTPANAEEFADNSGAPQDPRWDLPAPEALEGKAARDENAPLLVMLDPGHGGIDPGAETDVVIEKHLMLQFARELGEALVRSGQFTVLMTRDDDYFVSLERRIALAHQARADVFYLAACGYNLRGQGTWIHRLYAFRGSFGCGFGKAGRTASARRPAVRHRPERGRRQSDQRDAGSGPAGNPAAQ